MTKRWGILASCLLLLSFLVTGCYLASGEHTETTPLEGDIPGVYTVRFVSADGQTDLKVLAGPPNAPIVIEMSAQAEDGELQVAVLNHLGDAVFSTTARFGPSEVVSGTLRTDTDGRFALRVQATEVHGGSYTLRYRLVAPLTPTPTSPPTPTP